jgi:hypothetical protein
MEAIRRSNVIKTLKVKVPLRKATEIIMKDKNIMIIEQKRPIEIIMTNMVNVRRMKKYTRRRKDKSNREDKMSKNIKMKNRINLQIKKMMDSRQWNIGLNL